MRSTDMYTRVKPIDSGTLRVISNELEISAANMLTQFAPTFNELELYKLIIPEENFDVLYKASQLMPTSSNYITFNFLRRCDDEYNIKLNMIYPNNTNHIDWIVPLKLNPLTRESNLGERVFSIIDIASRWQNTITVVKYMFQHHRPAMVMHLMPWLKRIIQKEVNEPYTTPTLTMLRSLLSTPEPRNVPGMSPWLAYTMRDGDVMLTQYSLAKGKKIFKPDEVILTPTLILYGYDTIITGHCKEFHVACEQMNIPVLPHGGIN